ncbi:MULTISPECIES: hypothetical protein [Nocardia]|uniref:hypothetical protein n=1 Tax=Nocardia TaxID=1817 RepID=UPI000D69806A|nr:MULTISPECIES: hypothetical protein [Nocardia]
MQLCWSETSSTDCHATYSGQRTLCELPVIEARPTYASSRTDLTCLTCLTQVRRDLARRAAHDLVTATVGAGVLTGYLTLIDAAIAVIVPIALRWREQQHSWYAISLSLTRTVDIAVTESVADRSFLVALNATILESLRNTETFEAAPALRELRTLLDQMATQIPSVRHMAPGSNEPNYPLWWQLDATLTDAESGKLTQTQAWSAAVALLWATDTSDVIWPRCARRHQFVAAITGGHWQYTEPAPALPAVTVTARYQAQTQEHGRAVDVEEPHHWTVSPALAPRALQAILPGSTRTRLDFLIDDPAAPQAIRQRDDPFRIDIDYTIGPAASG